MLTLSHKNIHINGHVHTCTHKLAVFAHLVSHTHTHTKQQPDSNQQTRQIAEWKPVTCEEPHSPGRQTERQADRWQHVFVSQSSTSRTAVTAKLEQTILKPKNELSVNNSDGWSFREWIECVCLFGVGDGTENNSYHLRVKDKRIKTLLIIIASHLTATLSPSVAMWYSV